MRDSLNHGAGTPPFLIEAPQDHRGFRPRVRNLVDIRGRSRYPSRPRQARTGRTARPAEAILRRRPSTVEKISRKACVDHPPLRSEDGMLAIMEACDQSVVVGPPIGEVSPPTLLPTPASACPATASSTTRPAPILPPH